MRIIKTVVLLIVSVCVLGCAGHQIDTKAKQPLRLDLSKPIYVAWADGEYQEENKEVQIQFKEALLPYAEQVFAGTRPLPLNSAFKLAQNLKEGYVIYPQITFWQDNNTPWTTKRDRVNVEIVLVDANSMQVIAKTTLQGKSSSFVFKNDTPAAILPQLAEAYVNNLYL